jgi:hypothetical protein
MDGKTVKDYLKRIITEMDRGEVPSQAPRWVRGLAGPAAAGLALAVGSLGGCAGDADQEWTRERVAQAKADDLVNQWGGIEIEEVAKRALSGQAFLSIDGGTET